MFVTVVCDVLCDTRDTSQPRLMGQVQGHNAGTCAHLCRDAGFEIKGPPINNDVTHPSLWIIGLGVALLRIRHVVPIPCVIVIRIDTIRLILGNVLKLFLRNGLLDLFNRS